MYIYIYIYKTRGFKPRSHRYHEALGTTKPNPWIMLVAILKTSEIILNAEFICDRLLST